MTSTSPISSNSTLASRLGVVRETIAEECSRLRRSPNEVTLIAVTKFQPASVVRELAALGIRDVAESRHQEAEQKSVELRDCPISWHFVGQLQTKKARRVRAYSTTIHSVDRAALVDALAWGMDDDNQRLTDVFLQVNLSHDPGRGGVAESQLEPLVEHVLGAPGLRLRGVMAVAPLGEDPDRAFARLREASDRVQRCDSSAQAMSAGMSGDYRQALAWGATHLRIGSAITGKMPPG